MSNSNLILLVVLVVVFAIILHFCGKIASKAFFLRSKRFLPNANSRQRYK
jgi:high-affinity Fe2+/Pb2+ permease